MIHEYLANVRESVNRQFKNIIKSDSQVSKAMLHTVLAPSKCIRAGIVRAAAELESTLNKESINNLETAVEANAADLTAATGANLDLSQKSTTDLSEGTNLYYTDARADARVDAGFTAKSTTDLSEGTNLYYTDARVDSRYASLIVHDTGASLDLSQKDTGDLAEGTNLYFTDARAQAAVGAADVGLGNVDNTSDADKPVSTAQQTALDAKQDTLVAADYSSDTTTLATAATVDVTIAAGRSVNDVLVFADGLMKLPTTDYTISGTTLTFAVAPGNGVVVHVRYLPLG